MCPIFFNFPVQVTLQYCDTSKFVHHGVGMSCNVIPSFVKVNSQKVKELKWEGTHTQTASLSDIDTNKTYFHETTFFPFLSGRLAN